MLKRLICFTIAVGVFSSLSLTCEAQMEKRIDALYRYQAFLKAEPQIDTVAPDIVLKTLQGTEVKLSKYLGKPLVLVKGSYT